MIVTCFVGKRVLVGGDGCCRFTLWVGMLLQTAISSGIADLDGAVVGFVLRVVLCGMSLLVELALSPTVIPHPPHSLPLLSSPSTLIISSAPNLYLHLAMSSTNNTPALCTATHSNATPQALPVAPLAYTAPQPITRPEPLRWHSQPYARPRTLHPASQHVYAAP